MTRNTLICLLFSLFLFNSSVQAAYDFQYGCRTLFKSFWYYGSCYLFVATNQNWTESMRVCNSLNLTLAQIYSESMASELYEFYLPAIAANNKSTTEIWIGARKNSGSYSFYQNNNLTNGVPIVQYPIGNDPTYWNVAGTGDCVHLQYQAIDGSVHFYDNVSCTALKSSFCQYTSKFFQRGCDQSLTPGPGVINGTTTASSAAQCTQYCAATAWCAGVNYNSVTMECQLCTVKATDTPLEPNPCWNFYERNTCDVPGTVC